MLMVQGTGKRVIALRPAAPEDVDVVLALRNELDIRRWFLNPDPVAPEAHARWYRETLTGASRLLYLVIEDGAAAPIGYVRFDRTRPDAAEVSLAISPGRRGCGHGIDALVQGCRLQWAAWDVRCIEARVLDENKASMRMFLKAGFVVISTEMRGARPLSLLELRRPLAMAEGV